MPCLRKTYTLTLLLPAILLIGCVSGNSPTGVSQSAGTGNASPTTLHAVMSEQLIVDTARLNTLLFDLHRTETVLARERGEQYQRITDSARSLQRGAAQIAELAPSLQLPEDRLTRFRFLASQLKTLADSLATGAETAEIGPDQMTDVLARIDTTCNTCHSLYRNQ